MRLVAVESRHIEAGERHNADKCPVKLATREVLQGDVVVGYQYIVWKGHIVETPEEVIPRMQSWDRYGKMEPFSYWLPE